ncbi:pseudouridine synthase [Pilaira anomala]|nr:pseudouridine synthase [Pilaira anomala]
MNRWFKHVVSCFTNTKYIPSNYEKLSRTQLIQKIQTLENRLKKSHDKIKVDHAKPIDMSQYGERRIALKIAYLGWNYSGFASQGDETVTPTVEGQLFKALRSCNLIIDQDTCQFTRCGRTDKGVSGLGQVVALNVRSKQNKLAAEGSMPYIEIMNRLLPEDVRVLAWAPVSDTFNARFDCKSRTYKYFFEKGNLDLELMRQAAKYMTGSHDFRNFCKLDPSKNITNYERTILYLDILPVENGFYQVELKGTAFLWHQVRCIMSILFLVGQKLEKPEVVKALLDTEQVPSRPDYPMASDLPLMLYDCEFDGIQWIYANEGYRNIPTPLRTYRHFHELWSTHMIKGFLFNTVLEQIEHESVVNHQKVSQAIKISEAQQSNVLLGAGKSIRTAQYKPLLSRQRADSDQVKKEKYRLKQLNKK